MGDRDFEKIESHRPELLWGSSRRVTANSQRYATGITITQGTQSRNSILYSGQIKCPVADDGVVQCANRQKQDVCYWGC